LPTASAPTNATLGPPPALRLEPIVSVPGALAIVPAGDGRGRLFVAAQTGQIWELAGGQRQPSPLLDIAGRITSGGERGLLGLALHPQFPADPRLFVNYTDRGGDTVIASYQVASGESARADPASERVILHQDQPFPNHNGGGLAFGPDGYLYIALGDGGSGGDPQGNGQRLDTLLGKILRIDIDRADAGRAYRIPPDNPFVGRSGARGEIWHYGLRNPFRFSFDRLTGDLWIGDVGQNSREEIDVARAGTSGLNFGWAIREGFACFPANRSCSAEGLTAPVAEYRHDVGCTVIGGYAYRGSALPALVGWYAFADWCTGVLFVIEAARDGRQTPVRVGTLPGGVAGFGEDERGELYIANVGAGSVGRLVAG
jgi:glucose/arabinose dehydrogenase